MDPSDQHHATAASAGVQRQRRMLDVDGLRALLAALRRRGYTVIGPTLAEGAIVYDEIADIDDLPRGVADEQAPGRYRVTTRADGALFGYAVGPQAWKRYLLPPRHRLWQAPRTADGGWEVREEPGAPRYAFLGVRPCELAAIAVQDRVFLRGPTVDSVYARPRREVVLVAVQCGTPGGTCFCASTGTGPRAEEGFDLALTELLDDDGHRFLAEAGTTTGTTLLDEVPCGPVRDEDVAAAAAVTDRARERMGRELDTVDLRDLLARNLEHPRWDEVAERCLACGNCTLVCPTCFCTDIADVTDLAGDLVTRERTWGSCFSLDFTHLATGPLRASTRARYRQWMTHKLATWIDQFGTSGCVGCGRCITWCPVGIDITEEAAAIRATDASGAQEAAP